MRPLFRVRAVLSLILTAAAAGAAGAAGAGPSFVPWSLEAVVEHPRWIDFSRAMVKSHLARTSDDALRMACRTRLETGNASAEDPVSACIEASLRSLDNTSTYQGPRDYADARRFARPWVGIGFEIAGKTAGGPLRVARPIPGGPAEKAGIRPEDGVVEVDGVNFLPLSVDDCVRVMRGPEGSVMRVVLQRGDGAEPIRLAIRRARIRAITARATSLPGDIVHLRIVQFNEDTAASLIEQLEAVRPPGARRPAGVIVDLRHNPGGSVDSLVSVAGAFSPPGSPVVALVGRDGTEVRSTPADTRSLRDDTGAWLDGVALVVLANARTGGAAEALAQHLRETRDATVIGQRTAGASLIRTHVEVGGDAAVQISSAMMKSPRGQRWHEGLVPDVVLEAPPRTEPQASIEDDPWVQSAQRSFSGGNAGRTAPATPARADP